MSKKRDARKNPTLRESLAEIVDQANRDWLGCQRMQLEQHLRNGLNNGVPAETLSAVFDLSVDEIQEFEQTGYLKD